jgi:hypothetical protein
MSRSAISCLVAAALLGALSTASAQTRPPRTAISPPTLYAPPTPVGEIYAYDGGVYVAIHFPSVQGASGYRLTRVDNSIPNPPEVVVAEGAPNAFLGANGIYACNPDLSTLEWRRCAFRDPADNYWTEFNYPYTKHIDPILIKGHLYSYRVFALYPDGRISASSPVATLTFNHDMSAAVPLLP